MGATAVYQAYVPMIVDPNTLMCLKATPKGPSGKQAPQVRMRYRVQSAAIAGVAIAGIYNAAEYLSLACMRHGELRRAFLLLVHDTVSRLRSVCFYGLTQGQAGQKFLLDFHGA